MKRHGRVTGIVAALAAVAVSGIALADHNPGHSKEKPKDAPGKPVSKFSIKLQNLCVPDEGANKLTVYSTITNGTSGITDPVQIDQIQVQALQLVPNPDHPRKKLWDPVGTVDNNPSPGISIEPGASTVYEAPIDLCATYALREDAKALNAQVQIMIDGRNFVANCDDPDPDDGIDQAKIRLEDYPGLQCSSP
jgi:hypothetical protein